MNSNIYYSEPRDSGRQQKNGSAKATKERLCGGEYMFCVIVYYSIDLYIAKLSSSVQFENEDDVITV